LSEISPLIMICEKQICEKSKEKRSKSLFIKIIFIISQDSIL
jgi:hypothetical protein